ncbi:unnamed protein product, partial [Ilex paraguariensis]
AAKALKVPANGSHASRSFWVYYYKAEPSIWIKGEKIEEFETKTALRSFVLLLLRLCSCIISASVSI